MMGHIEENENGDEKIKTIGKLLDNKVCLEGLVPVVLGAKKIGDEYKFVTQTSGNDTLKSPMGMFEEIYVPNDLEIVDNTIVDYWGLEK